MTKAEATHLLGALHVQHARLDIERARIDVELRELERRINDLTSALVNQRPGATTALGPETQNDKPSVTVPEANPPHALPEVP